MLGKLRGFLFTDVSGQSVDNAEHGAENKRVEWKGICVLCWSLDF